MTRTFAALLMLFLGSVLSSCEPSGATFKTYGERTVEPAGKIDFTISGATIETYKFITLPDGSSFVLDSVSFDRDHSVAYLNGQPADPAEPTNTWPSTDYCTSVQTLTSDQLRALQTQFEAVHLCRVHVPLGTPEPLYATLNHGTVSGWGRSYSSPLGYVDNSVDICDFSDLSLAADVIVSQIDLSKPMSCVPKEIWAE